MNHSKYNVSRLGLATVLIAAMLTVNITNIAFAASPGAFDSSFDTDGFVITSVGSGDNPQDAAIQTDGKIVVVGQSVTGVGNVTADVAVVRYNADGSLDLTFSTDGKETTDFGGIDVAFGVAIQTDGKIVVAGSTTVVGGTNDFAIARYNTNGSLDTTFDTDGKVTTDFATFNDVANGLAIQTDGKIVAVGRANLSAGSQQLAAARYNTNGALDTTFDTDGKITINSSAFTTISAVALQTDQKIVMVGGDTFTSFKVCRLNTNGSLDGAIITTAIPGTTIESASSVAIQTDGKIVVGGFGVGVVIVRYNTNLSLDTTFDTDGIADIDVNPTVSNERASDIELQTDGKIVCAITVFGTAPSFTALRLNANGSRDSGFGIDGVTVANLGIFSLSNAVEIQTDGKIILIGETGASTNGIDFAIARLSIEKHPTASSDFDGDGGADTTVYRPSAATWFTLRSSDLTVMIEQFGLNGDIPIDGDFDGDGRADLAIFRPSSGVWFFKRSSNATTLGAQFGNPGDKPVVGDYDKDGKTDIAVFRPATGENFILRSSSNFSTFFAYPFGQNGDINIMSGAQ